MRIYCPRCQAVLDGLAQTPTICPHCGSSLTPEGGVTVVAAPRAAQPDTVNDLAATGPERPPAEPFWLVIPGYEILDELGKGGMGVVYKARHLALGRLVALKMIRAGRYAEADERERFLAEARAIARLAHPNIVQVFEIGETDGLPYFALEFIHGQSLDRTLRGIPLPPVEAARLMQPLARAIQAAHDEGIVHRDLKPANVLLRKKSDGRSPRSPLEQQSTVPGQSSELGSGTGSDTGLRMADYEPKVTDFGLAKSLEEDRGQTQTGAILGTPSYMAPEQAEGRTHDVGPAADVYALGAVLYEMLTGRPPFRGASRAETVSQVITREPVPPVVLQPGVPLDLNTICLKCLQKEPARRYGSAREVAEDVERFLEGRPILARPVGRIERARRWCRRNPAVASLSTAVAVALLLLLAGGVAAFIQVRNERDDADIARADAEEKGEQYRQQKVIADQNAERADHNAANEKAQRERADTKAWQSDLHARIAAVREREARAQQARADAEADGKAGQLSRFLINSGLRHQQAGDSSAGLLCFAEALRRDLANPARSRVNQLRLTTHLAALPRLVHTWQERGTIKHVSFSPDGRREMVNLEIKEPTDPKEKKDLDRRNLCLWDLATGRETRLTHQSYSGWPTFSADGRHIVFNNQDSYQYGSVVWDCTREEASGLATVRALPAVLEIGRVLAVGMQGPWHTYLAQRTGHESLWRLLRAYQNPPFVRAAFSADGRQAVMCEFQSWCRVATDSGRTLQRGSLPPFRTDTGLLLSPDGRHLLIFSQDSSENWFVPTLVDTRTGKQIELPLRLTQRDGLQRHPQFSPDGTLLSIPVGTEVYLWRPGTGEPAAPPLRHAHPVQFVLFSADSRRILTGTGESRSIVTHLQLWDASSGNSFGTIRAGEGETLTGWASVEEPFGHVMVPTLQLTPDGTRLITCSDSHGVKLWSFGERGLPTRTPRELSKGFSLGRRACFSPRGDIAAVLHQIENQDWQLSLFDLGREAASRPTVISVLGPDTRLCFMEFSPDGRRLFVAHRDGVLVVDVASRATSTFRPLDGQPVWVPESYNVEVPGVRWSPDGRHLIIVAADRKAAWLWDTESYRPTSTPALADVWFGPDRAVRGLTQATTGVQTIDLITGQEVGKAWKPAGNARVFFSSDGRRVLTAPAPSPQFGAPAEGAEIQVWDALRGEPLHPPFRHRAAATDRVALSPNGQMLATAHGDDLITVWSLTYQTTSGHQIRFEGGLASFAFTADGSHLAVTRRDGLVQIHSAYRTPGSPDAFSSSPPFRLTGELHVRRSSSSSPSRAVVWDGTTVSVVDGLTRERQGEAVKLPGKIRDVEVSEASSYNAHAAVTDDRGTLLVLDLRTGAEVYRATLEPATLRITWSTDSLLATSGKEVLVWKAGQKAPLRLECDSPIDRIAAFGQITSRIVTVHGKQAQLWEPVKGTRIGSPLEHSEPITQLIPGTYSFTAVAGRAVHQWSLTDGTPVGKAIECASAVDRVWIRSGSTVVTVCGKELRLWDAKTGKPQGDPFQLPGPITAEAMASYGPLYLACGKDLVAVGSSGNPDPHVLLSHRDPITALAGARGGSVALVIADGKGTVRVLSTTGKDTLPAVEHGEAVTLLCRSDDGNLVLVAGKSQARLWNLAQSGPPGQARPVGPAFTLEDELVEVDFGRGYSLPRPLVGRTRSGKLLNWMVVGDRVIDSAVVTEGVRGVRMVNSSGMAHRLFERQGNTVKMYSLTTGQLLRTLEHDGNVETLEFNQNNIDFVTVTEHGTLRRWHTGTGQPITAPLDVAQAVKEGSRIKGQSSGESWVTFRGKEAIAWDFRQGLPLSGPLVHDEPVRAALWLDRTRLVTAAGTSVQLWDSLTGKKVGAALRHSEPIKTLRVVGQMVIAAGEREVGAWRLTYTPGQPLAPVNSIKTPRTLRSMTVDQNGACLLLSDQLVQVWNPQSGQVFTEATLPVEPKSWFWAQGGGQLLMLGADGQVYSFRAFGGRPGEKSTLKPVSLGFRAVEAAINADGSRVLTRGNDHTAQLWDVESGKPLDAVLSHEGELTGAWFTPEGRRVLTLGSGQAGLWDAATGQRLRQTRLPPATYSPTISTDGRWAFFPSSAGKSRSVQRWDLSSGELEAVGPENATVLSIRSASGHVLFKLSAEKENPARYQAWDLVADRAIGDVVQFDGSIHGEFSPDGSLLVLRQTRTTKVKVGSKDESQTSWETRVWDVETGRPLTAALQRNASTPDGQSDPPLPVFSPDSACVLVVTKDGARLWDAHTGDPVSPVLQPPHSVTGPSWGGGFPGGGEIGSPGLRTNYSDTSARFSPDGRWLQLYNSRGSTLWDLGSTNEPEALIAAAELRAGRTTDETGAFTALTPSQRDELTRRLGTSSSLSAEVRWRGLMHWHREQARLRGNSDPTGALRHLNALLGGGEPDTFDLLDRRAAVLSQLGQHEAAAADYLRLTEDGKRAGQALLILGQIRWQRGSWNQAIQDFRKASEADPAPPDALHNLAIGALYRGDHAGYRKGCAALLDRDEKGTPAARRAALGTCLVGQNAADAERLVKLIDSLADTLPSQETAVLRGAVQFRTGKTDEAIRTLQSLSVGQGTPLAGVRGLFLALALQRKGDRTRALEALGSRGYGVSYSILGTSAWRASLEQALLSREVATVFQPRP